MKTTITFIILFLGFIYSSQAQNYKVDVEGDGDELIRIHSTPQINAMSGIDLILGNSGGTASGDWRVANEGGKLHFISDNTNFSGSGTSRVTITRFGDFGIGTAYPNSRLQIIGGDEASPSDHGHFVIGNISGTNMVFDENEINTRSNGGSSSLYLQRHGGNIYTGSGGGNIFLSQGGGNTYTGYTGGNTYLAYGGGKTSVGGTAVNAKFNITDDSYQLYLKNDDGDVNDWYIGASADGWSVGDDQLIFGPTSSSSAAILRLKDVVENNGTEAPVMISSSGGGQLLLIDGNEIDASSPLYINHNTNQNTYINPTGGKVAVGSASPWGRFHVEYTGSSQNEQVLTLETPKCAWGITPSNTVGNNNLFFRPSGNGGAVSGISSVNGAWLTFSDRRMKENITSLSNLLDKVNSLGLYSYTIIGDNDQSPNIGVIAQEINEVFPELVNELDDKFAVNYGQLSVVALKAIQELSAENTEIKTRLNRQQEMIAKLSSQMEQLMNSK